jgi:hypothetical protein
VCSNDRAASSRLVPHAFWVCVSFTEPEVAPDVLSEHCVPTKASCGLLDAA